MEAKIRALSLLVVLAVTVGACEMAPPKHPQFGEPVDKYLDMKGKPTSGVVVEIQELVDGEKAVTSVAEVEVINALKDAGIPVLVKGKPEFIVFGNAEANVGGPQKLYGREFLEYNASVTLKVIDTRDAVVVGAESAQARKLGTTREGAARDATKEAVAAAARKIAQLLRQKIGIGQ